MARFADQGFDDADGAELDRRFDEAMRSEVAHDIDLKSPVTSAQIEAIERRIVAQFLDERRLASPQPTPTPTGRTVAGVDGPESEDEQGFS